LLAYHLQSDPPRLQHLVGSDLSTDSGFSRHPNVILEAGRSGGRIPHPPGRLSDPLDIMEQPAREPLGPAADPLGAHRRGLPARWRSSSAGGGSNRVCRPLGALRTSYRNRSTSRITPNGAMSSPPGSCDACPTTT